MAEKLSCDIEEIKPKVNYGGKIGYARGIKDAIAAKNVDLEKLNFDASKYDEIIFGVPVWASKAANPLISYIQQNKDKINTFKLFITAGSNGFESTTQQINECVGTDASKTAYIRTIDVKNDTFTDAIDEFIQ